MLSRGVYAWITFWNHREMWINPRPSGLLEAQKRLAAVSGQARPIPPGSSEAVRGDQRAGAASLVAGF